MNPLVKITSVADQVGFDPKTLLPAQFKVITYTVGDHGPFKLVTPRDQFTADYVDRETQKEVDVLKAIGAIPPQ